GWGIEFMSGRAQGSAQNTKLRDHIVSSGAYSIEAWVVPATVNQGTAGDPARIISYSAGTTTRNFTLGQAEYRYEYMNRNEYSDANGMPSFITSDADEDLQASQQHVVVTYDPTLGRKIYVNGVDVSTTGMDADVDPATPLGGSLTDWDDSFAFILGSEAGGADPWVGKLRLVAIHNRAMTQAQITQNFDAGVGEKFFLMFSVSDLINDPNAGDSNCFLASAVTTGNPRGDQCFIYMLVSQFDSYSYLFNAPTFISLNPAFAPGGTPISGMRIGLNGKEPAVGQAYVNVGKPTPVTINAGAYDPLNGGQIISSIGTIIALEKGAGADEFFLSFEEFGANTDVRTAFVCNPIADCMATPVDGTPVSDIGVRTFDDINATMAGITGVDRNTTSVKSTFDTIKQQLPPVETIDGFVSANQMAIAQLAIQYCDALVESTGLNTGLRDT
ncbi:MAG: LamG domain-containing protein, partial [Gammaproteobacteria bacterium]|nr:LamG domain-containing protein [Gammaproteobacteria bacterium]